MDMTETNHKGIMVGGLLIVAGGLAYYLINKRSEVSIPSQMTSEQASALVQNIFPNSEIISTDTSVIITDPGNPDNPVIINVSDIPIDNPEEYIIDQTLSPQPVGGYEEVVVPDEPISVISEPEPIIVPEGGTVDIPSTHFPFGNEVVEIILIPEETPIFTPEIEPVITPYYPSQLEISDAMKAALSAIDSKYGNKTVNGYVSLPKRTYVLSGESTYKSVDSGSYVINNHWIDGGESYYSVTTGLYPMFTTCVVSFNPSTQGYTVDVTFEGGHGVVVLDYNKAVTSVSLSIVKVTPVVKTVTTHYNIMSDPNMSDAERTELINYLWGY